MRRYETKNNNKSKDPDEEKDKDIDTSDLLIESRLIAQVNSIGRLLT
jgi:hypothetical protein